VSHRHQFRRIFSMLPGITAQSLRGRMGGGTSSSLEKRGRMNSGGRRKKVRTADSAAMLGALKRAQEEADQLFELAACKDRQLAVALAHRLSSSLAGMRFAIEASAAFPVVSRHYFDDIRVHVAGMRLP